MAPLSRLTLRAVAFGVAFVVLLAAVPALAWVGKERLLDSRGGNVVDANSVSTDPGYRALVDPTQTALVLQRPSADGEIVSATVLALGQGQAGGGTVLQVPLNTKLREPRFTYDRLAQVAEVATTEDFASVVADRLNVALPTVVELDDGRLSELVAPVAPLTIDNPDAVVLETGEVLESGPVSLEADQLGPYLRADEGGSDLGRLARDQVVWEAWLAAIGDSDSADAVGPATTGIGPFLRTLGAGDPVIETLDVVQDPEPAVDDPDYTIPLVPAPGFDEQVVDAVPYPRSPAPGRRYNLELLNGASGDDVPRSLIHDLVLGGASLTTLGNAAEFGQAETTLAYDGEGWADAAALAAGTLGGAEVTAMSPAEADAAGDDIVITLGSDTLDRYEGN